MEPMTDAFLTASVLAAVAQGAKGQNTTRITGIANQRVKECDRIKAMKDELARFNVTCRELFDGIEIDGIGLDKLCQPTHGVNCYDDHRVAMSFSVLAFASPHATLIRERECVGKTWPGWWDTLAQAFNARLKGVDLDSSTATPETSSTHKSIFIIGMRGAGKTTTGAWAETLGWRFADLDSQLELEVGCSLTELIEKKGWDGFREKELAVLRNSMEQRSTGYVFACGGGVVEIPAARQLLTAHHKSGGLVLLVHRNISDIMEFLQSDKTRPAYTEDMLGVWLRREPWYKQCSNYEYYSQKLKDESLSGSFKDFSRLLSLMVGRKRPLEEMLHKRHSFFVSLTVPNVSEAVGKLDEIVVGSDAVELRVDLLQDDKRPDEIPKVNFVRQQLAALRRCMDLPIIFTVRTQSQGGNFPNAEVEEAMALMELALRMGVEFLDVEMQLPEHLIRSIVKRKGQTIIIASHHDSEGRLSWGNGSWIPHLNKALQYGDILKVVGVAREQDENLKLAQFRAWVETTHKIPIIALNMGVEGQLSRIQNSFMTPVSHPALPSKAAPGQLSAAELRIGLALHGVIKPKKFYIFGAPISASRSPSMHNTLFKVTGLPHEYALFEATSAQDVEDIIQSNDFGGASVTMPLKLDIMKYMDEISEDAKLIGAVNTIVIDKQRAAGHGAGRHLTGHNTDWQGMKLVLRHAGVYDIQGQSGMIIGCGGTARSAIHALHEIGCSPLYLLGRKPEKVFRIVESFPREYNLQIAASLDDFDVLPTIAIGTIPGDNPIDPKMRRLLLKVLGARRSSREGEGIARVLLEMAYNPITTPLMELAHSAGWATIPGLESLAGQGYFQVCLINATMKALGDFDNSSNSGRALDHYIGLLG
jgi:pentafunctional AROM polypeptide